MSSTLTHNTNTEMGLRVSHARSFVDDERWDGHISRPGEFFDWWWQWGWNKETHHHHHKNAFPHLQATTHLWKILPLHPLALHRKDTKNASVRGHAKANQLACASWLESAAKSPPPTIRTTSPFHKPNSTQTGQASEIGFIVFSKAIKAPVRAPLSSTSVFNS